MPAFVVVGRGRRRPRSGAPSSRSSPRSSPTAFRGPRNLEAAQEFESILREQGVTPGDDRRARRRRRASASTPSGVRRIADEELAKASVRDLPIIRRAGRIGRHHGRRDRAPGRAGRHPRLRDRRPRRRAPRRASDTFDESADLTTLASTPITVVSAGREVGARHRGDARAPRDAERSGRRLPHARVPELLAAREPVHAGLVGGWRRRGRRHHARQDALGSRQGIIVANPVPVEQQWDPRSTTACWRRRSPPPTPRRHDRQGRDAVPAQLHRRASGGRSLEVNLDLARNNVRVAGEIATAWAAPAWPGDER